MDKATETPTSLEQLESKIKMLLSRYAQQKEELHKLRQENETLKLVVQQQNETLNHFQYTEKISMIVNSLAADAVDKNELKAKIDDYIREIDSCIAYLNKQL